MDNEHTKVLSDRMPAAWNKFLTQMPDTLLAVVLADTKIATVLHRTFEAGYWLGAVTFLDYMGEQLKPGKKGDK